MPMSPELIQAKLDEVGQAKRALNCLLAIRTQMSDAWCSTLCTCNDTKARRCHYCTIFHALDKMEEMLAKPEPKSVSELLRTSGVETGQVPPDSLAERVAMLENAVGRLERYVGLQQ